MHVHHTQKQNTTSGAAAGYKRDTAKSKTAGQVPSPALGADKKGKRREKEGAHPNGDAKASEGVEVPRKKGRKAEASAGDAAGRPILSVSWGAGARYLHVTWPLKLAGLRSQECGERVFCTSPWASRRRSHKKLRRSGPSQEEEA